MGVLTYTYARANLNHVMDRVVEGVTLVIVLDGAGRAA